MLSSRLTLPNPASLPAQWQGAFVGALVAMSSTSIVVKVLSDCSTQHSQPGQITIGTLVMQVRLAGLQLRCEMLRFPLAAASLFPGLACVHTSAPPHTCLPHPPTRPQDCLVGLLFAFMPVLAMAAGGSSEYDLVLLLTVMGRVVAKLAVLAVGALVLARTVLPPTWRWLARRFGPESFQLASIAFCLLCALITARQGVSAELGAFAAGVMLSATEQQEAVLHHLGEAAALMGRCGCVCCLLRALSALHVVLPLLWRAAAWLLLCERLGYGSHPPALPAPHFLAPSPSAAPSAEPWAHQPPLQSRWPSSSWPCLSPPPAWCSALCSWSTTCRCWPAAPWPSSLPRLCWCAGGHTGCDTDGGRLPVCGSAGRHMLACTEGCSRLGLLCAVMLLCLACVLLPARVPAHSHMPSSLCSQHTDIALIGLPPARSHMNRSVPCRLRAW